MTPRKFGIPSTISQKPIKLGNSNLVHSFSLASPTSLKYNISERGHGLAHVTPRIFGIPSTISQKPIKPDRDFKFGKQLILGFSHKNGV